MKSDWVVCIDTSGCTYINEGRKYLVRWNGNYCTILKTENNPFALANGRSYKRERFKLVSTMNKETIPQITNYLHIDEYGEIGTFKTPEELESHMEDIYDAEAYHNDQIVFVYDNGNVTQRYVVDVVNHKPTLKPEFK